MGVLSKLKPELMFGYFETICAIPHGSGNTDAIAEYLVNFAAERGFECSRDGANNVLMTVPASAGREADDTIILQSHTDMVCEKDEGVDFDFTKDALRLRLDGDTLTAEGTTLGADNGISVAMMLALADEPGLSHPKLELLFTSDEEIGMVGAFAFDPGKLTGHRFINLDSEYEGVLMCSCAGGANAYTTLPVKRAGAKLELIELSVGGLASGHSGVEIDKGRANSNVLMARLLRELASKAEIRLVGLEGGSRETAIAALTTAVIGADCCAEELVKAAEALGESFKREYATAEPGMTVTVKAVGAETVDAVTAEDSARAIALMQALPDSVQAMSVDMPGLVQTSLNFGIVKLKDSELYCANTVRSSMTSQKLWILDKVASIACLAGARCEVSGSYPGWSYNPRSAVKDAILSSYKELFGRDATVEAVHAGIECGLFADSIPELDCVSIGPEMGDVHTPREHLSVSSAARTYELLKSVLGKSF